MFGHDQNVPTIDCDACIFRRGLIQVITMRSVRNQHHIVTLGHIERGIHHCPIPTPAEPPHLNSKTERDRCTSSHRCTINDLPRSTSICSNAWQQHTMQHIVPPTVRRLQNREGETFTNTSCALHPTKELSASAQKIKSFPKVVHRVTMAAESGNKQQKSGRCGN